MLRATTILPLLLLLRLAAAVDLTLPDLAKMNRLLLRQIQLQQFQMQERVRSEGNSGIKQLRVRHSGSSNYHSETHSGRSLAAIHDHSNHERTAGMGEFVAVLNGVEFRTRHNDYRLMMPARNSSELHAVEDIPFPEVPPEVLRKKGVEEQAEELREWFKAWRDQNHKVRDYRKYFKPVLCYLEGAWFHSKLADNLQESFQSDRHFLDAQSWGTLHAKAEFMAYSGSKSRKENLAVLPSAFFGRNGSWPQVAQFNYRILCHPLREDLPLAQLHLKEDLSSRFFGSSRRTMAQLRDSRAARFAFNSRRSANRGGQFQVGLLDELMSQIPGKDNYQGRIFSAKDDDDGVYEVDGTRPLNQAFYHRYYQLKSPDAMGLNLIHRSFSDDFLFAARTSQPSVAGKDLLGRCRWRRLKCRRGPGCRRGWRRKRQCPRMHEKWSWAVPLEVIFLTPLHRWNPYNLPFRSGNDSEAVTEKWARNGICAPGPQNRPYNGTHQRLFYRTPVSFFAGRTTGRTKADTVRTRVCALDAKGQVREVTASGVFVLLPPIKGVGVLRTRFPVMPVHGEGSAVWKELNAVRDLLMDRERLKNLLFSPEDEGEGLDLTLRTSRSGGQKHSHFVELSGDQVAMLKAGRAVTVVTEQRRRHTHRLTLKMNRKTGRIFYKDCDGRKLCFDEHPKVLTEA